MKTELLLKFEFIASHSLPGFETPHPHIWKLEVGVSGQPRNGKIVDMVELRQSFQEVLNPLISTYLNECHEVGTEVRKFPTCETLSQHFLEKFSTILSARFLKENSTIQLSSVNVGICGMDGVETGAVKLTVT